MNANLGRQLYDHPSEHAWLKSTSIVGLTCLMVSAGVFGYLHFVPNTKVIEAPKSSAIAIEIAALPSAPKQVNDVVQPVVKPKSVEQKKVEPVTEKKPPEEKIITTVKNKVAETEQKEEKKELEKDLKKEQKEKEVAQNNRAEQNNAESEKAQAQQLNNSAHQSNSNGVAEWENSVLNKLEKMKRYPVVAQKMKQQDVVTVRFTLDSTGKVLNYRIENSQKFPLLDREALELIKRASPFPAPPPEALVANQAEIRTPINFHLK